MSELVKNSNARKLQVIQVDNDLSVEYSNVFVHAHCNAGQTVYNETETPLIYDTVDYDDLGCYNPTNGFFIAPKTALYTVHAGWFDDAYTSIGLVGCYQLGLYVNGSLASVLSSMSFLGGSGISYKTHFKGTAIVRMATGSNLNLQFYFTESSNHTTGSPAFGGLNAFNILQIVSN